MPVNESSSCGVVPATHILVVKGASRVSFRDLRSHEQARGGRFRKNDFTRLNSYEIQSLLPHGDKAGQEKLSKRDCPTQEIGTLAPWPD